jgi:hypothetical protein
MTTLFESLLNDIDKNKIYTRECEVDEKYLPDFEKVESYVKEHGDDSVKLSFDRSWGITVLFKNPASGDFDNRSTDLYLREAYKKPNGKLKIFYSYKNDDRYSPTGFKLKK